MGNLGEGRARGRGQTPFRRGGVKAWGANSKNHSLLSVVIELSRRAGVYTEAVRASWLKLGVSDNRCIFQEKHRF